MVTASRVLACVLALATMVAPAWADGESLRASVMRVDAAQPPVRDVYVSVSDSRGQPVTGLSRDAFALTEDGTSVPIDRVALANDSQQPIAFGLLMDVSGSMNGAKLDAAKQAADNLVASLGPADAAAVISFADRATVVQEFTSDHNALTAAIDGLQTNGDTALYDALERGLLLAEALPQTRRIILLVTDGDDTRSVAKVDDVVKDAAGAHSLIYAVGLGNDVNPGVLNRLTSAGLGQSLYPGDPSELDGIFQSVLNQLRYTYVLRYRSPASPTGNHTVAAQVNYQGQTAQGSNSFTLSPAPVVAELAGVVSGEAVTGARQLQAVVRSGAAQRIDLVVDGQTLASSVGQPTTVTGNLGALDPGPHSVRVRVTDALGAVTENEVPITVPGPATPVPTTVPTPVATPVPPNPSLATGDLWAWLVLAGTLLLGLIGLLVLILRRRPQTATAAAAAAADDATLEVGAADGAPTPPLAGPRLLVERGGQQFDVPITDETFSIGREASNNLVLRDPHVSRHHALITRQQGGYWIEDLKSQNGTLQDGRVRIDRKQLNPGDQFLIGDTQVAFALGAAAPASEKPPYDEDVKSVAVASAARS